MTFEPTWHNGQLATSPCGGSNCLVWSGARAVERDSKGAIDAVTGDIRRWISGTTCGGTTLAQVSAAVKALYGVELLIRYSLPWADFLTLIASGRGAATYIGYAAMHGSGFDSFPTFNGGHGVYVGEVDRSTALVYDPGADGRRAGIPLGPQRWPLELLKKAAGAMPAGSGTVGYGFVSAGFTRDTEDEDEMNAKTQAPGLLCDIGPTTLYADEACTTPAFPSWPGFAGVGLYATAASPGVKSLAVRVDNGSEATGHDWRLVYAPFAAVSNARANPALCPAPATSDVAAAIAKGYADAKAKAVAAVEAL